MQLLNPTEPEHVDCSERWTKRGKVSDRARRYRAVACRPPGKNCYFCGRPERSLPEPLHVAHIDGDERNSVDYNYGLTCRSCNAIVAHVMKDAGLGRRAVQYNPSAGAKSVGQWLAAVMSMKGESDQMPVDVAVDMIHATPAATRSRFAQEIWSLRRRSGHAGRKYLEKAPF